MLSIIANIVTILPAIGIELGSIGFNGIILTIVSIISLITNVLILGYIFSIIQKTIKKIDIIPSIEISENIINGIRVFIITIIYFLMPLLISLVLAVSTGTLNKFIDVINSNAGAISNELTLNLLVSFYSIMIVATILFIIFTLIETIAIARFADKGNMRAAFEFGEIFNTISNIGWGNYIIWFVSLFIILITISFIAGLIDLIPILGIIITSLIFIPYLSIFSARSIGLIYNEKN